MKKWGCPVAAAVVLFWIIVCLPVISYAETYSYVTQWGSQVRGNGQFDNPRGVAIDSSGNVYVVDRGNNRVQKFTSDGTYVTQWGSDGSSDGQFDIPTGVAVDSSDNVYVADSSNYRIQKFSAVPPPSASTIYATWTGQGLYSWNGTTWTRIGSVPASMATGD